MDDMELKALDKSRENMYRLLSRLYLLEVGEDLLAALISMQFPSQSPQEDLTEGYEAMQQYLKEVKERMEADENSCQEILDELAVDYARIFLSAGVAQGKAAFPFESVYTSKKHLVMQDSRNDVIALYAAEGLTPGKEMYRVPEDHLGLLLEYMAILCGKEKRDAAGQEAFLKNHLLNWVPAFTVDVVKYASTDFYRGLGKLTRGFLKLERSLFADA